MVDAGLVIEGDGRVARACGSAVTTGNGLTIAADDVVVSGLEISDCPGNGVQVTGHDVIVGNAFVGAPPMWIHDNDLLGVLVNGLSTQTSGVFVWGLRVSDNCLSTTASCAGIGIRKGTGQGAGPVGVFVVLNDIDGQQSGGHGVGVFAGADHQVVSNTIGLVAGNTGSGIAVTANTGVTAQVDSIEDNLVVANAQSGILLGARSTTCGVFANLVGTDGVTDLGNGNAGIEVFGSDHHTIEENVGPRSPRPTTAAARSTSPPT